MKTYSKQSARQRGDYVIHLRGFPGRYTCLHCATLNPADEKVSASQVRQRQRVMFYNDALSKSVTASGQAQLLLAQERGRAVRPSDAVKPKIKRLTTKIWVARSGPHDGFGLTPRAAYHALRTNLKQHRYHPLPPPIERRSQTR